jgi:hypothetical protein
MLCVIISFKLLEIVSLYVKCSFQEILELGLSPQNCRSRRTKRWLDLDARLSAWRLCGGVRWWSLEWSWMRTISLACPRFWVLLIWSLSLYINNLENLNNGFYSDFLPTLNYPHFLHLQNLYIRFLVSKLHENCEKEK